MADIAKINLDGISYNIKDATSRTTAEQAKATAGQAKTTAEQAKTTAEQANTAITTIKNKKFAVAEYSEETLTITNTLVGG